MFWWLGWLELYIICEKCHGLHLIPTRWCKGKNWWTERWTRIICFFQLKAELFGSFKSQGLKSYQIIWRVVRCLEARSSVSSSTEREAFRKHKKQKWKEFSLHTQHIIATQRVFPCFRFFYKNMLVFLRKKNPISPRLQLSKVDPQQRLTSAEACELEVFKVSQKRLKSILRYSMLGGETSWRDVSFHEVLMRMKVDESLISRWGVSKPSCFLQKNIYEHFLMFSWGYSPFRIIGIPLSIHGWSIYDFGGRMSIDKSMSHCRSLKPHWCGCWRLWASNSQQFNG